MLKNVLGVRIDDVSENEAVAIVTSWLKGSQVTKLIFTPGPEFIVQASDDLEFRRVLNSSDLNIPDGFGLKFAGVENRIPGVDFMMRLCSEAEKNGWKIGLLGGWEGEGKETSSKLKQMYHTIHIPLIIDGQEADDFLNPKRALKRHLPEVDILFVAMGHFTQEKLLAKMKEKNSKLKNDDLKFVIGVGVGSSMDLITERVKRTPRILRKMGLEWTGRLARNPKHFTRVFRATAVFLFLLLKKNLF